jgi:hypothetical protein
MIQTGQSNYGGSVVGADFSPGVGPILDQTLMTSPYSANTNAINSSAPTAGSLQSQFLGEPVAVWLGMVALLIVLKWLSERKNDNRLNPADIRISGYNVLAVTVTAMVGFIAFKVIFNKFNVPGVTQFVNAV